MLHLIEKVFTETISKKQLLMSISKLIFQVENAMTSSLQTKESADSNKLSLQLNPIESLFKDYDQSAYKVVQLTVNDIRARLELIESLKINLNHSLTLGDEIEIKVLLPNQLS